MRLLGILKEPMKCNDREMTYKVVVHETPNGAFVYLYCDPDAKESSYDEWYARTEDALNEWSDALDENGWKNIGEPPFGKSDGYIS